MVSKRIKSREHAPYGICEQERCRSDCAFAQSDQNFSFSSIGNIFFSDDC